MATREMESPAPIGQSSYLKEEPRPSLVFGTTGEFKASVGRNITLPPPASVVDFRSEMDFFRAHMANSSTGPIGFEN